MACIEGTRHSCKSFGNNIALDGINLRVEEGPHSWQSHWPQCRTSKTTALNAILGLTSYQGELRVLGRDPWTERDQLMRDVCFISDVAVLPRWIRVSQALDYVAGVHPRFDRAKAESFLAKTTIRREQQGQGIIESARWPSCISPWSWRLMRNYLCSIEPTLGLDLLYRKRSDSLSLNDYFDRNRTIVVTTHQVEELQHVLTDPNVWLTAGGLCLIAAWKRLSHATWN